VSSVVGKLMLSSERKILFNVQRVFKKSLDNYLNSGRIEVEKETENLFRPLLFAYSLGVLVSIRKRPRKLASFAEEELFLYLKQSLKSEWIVLAKIVGKFFENADEAVSYIFHAHKPALKFLESYTVSLSQYELQALATEVTDAVRHTLLRGMSEEEATKYIQERFKAFEKKRAKAIARTETTRAFNVGDLANTVQYVEGYRFTAVLDDRTTDICQERHGMFIPAHDVDLLAMNTPPLHVNCRSYLIPELHYVRTQEILDEHKMAVLPPIQKRAEDVEIVREILRTVR